MAFDYDHAFNAAKTAFEELDKRRAENAKKLSEINVENADIEKQMVALKQAMDILAPFAAGKPLEYVPGTALSQTFGAGQPVVPLGWSAAQFDAAEIGMTQAIRSMLRAQGKYALSASQVRDRLVACQFNLSGYKNAMAAIYTVLGRIAIEVDTKEGKKYRLRQMPRPRFAGNVPTARVIVPTEK